MLALGLGFTACDNDFDFPNPPGQSNPQEPVFESASLTLASAVNGTVSLEDADAAATFVSLAEITAVDSLPGYKLKFVGQMSSADNFANPFEFPVTLAENTLTANPDDLDAGFRGVLNTLDPAAKDVNIRFKAYAVNDNNEQVRLGGTDVFYCPMKASIKPFNPGFTVEDTYYLVGTVTGGSLDPASAVKMTNSGISPYDDPVFSCVVDITGDQAAAGYEWAVVPASTLAAGSGLVLAPSDPELAGDATGYLKVYESTGVWGMVSESNNHLFTVNVRPDEDGLYSYKVELAIPNLWTPGPSNGWNQGASQLLYTDNYKYYQGFVHIDGEFKFTSAPDWSHTNFGFEAPGKLTSDGAAGNIKVSQNDEPLTNGLYWCTADIVALTYTTDAIKSLGLIGDATEGGWDKETAMTPSEDFLTWTVTTTLKEGTFKIRANNDWVIDFGGTLDNLVFKGPNIPAPKTGTVTIILNLSTLPYTATVK